MNPKMSIINLELLNLATADSQLPICHTKIQTSIQPCLEMCQELLSILNHSPSSQIQKVREYLSHERLKTLKAILLSFKAYNNLRGNEREEEGRLEDYMEEIVRKQSFIRKLSNHNSELQATISMLKKELHKKQSKIVFMENRISSLQNILKRQTLHELNDTSGSLIKDFRVGYRNTAKPSQQSTQGDPLKPIGHKKILLKKEKLFMQTHNNRKPSKNIKKVHLLLRGSSQVEQPSSRFSQTQEESQKIKQKGLLRQKYQLARCLNTHKQEDEHILTGMSTSPIFLSSKFTQVPNEQKGSKQKQRKDTGKMR